MPNYRSMKLRKQTKNLIKKQKSIKQKQKPGHMIFELLKIKDKIFKRYQKKRKKYYINRNKVKNYKRLFIKTVSQKTIE